MRGANFFPTNQLPPPLLSLSSLCVQLFSNFPSPLYFLSLTFISRSKMLSSVNQPMRSFEFLGDPPGQDHVGGGGGGGDPSYDPNATLTESNSVLASLVASLSPRGRTSTNKNVVSLAEVIEACIIHQLMCTGILYLPLRGLPWARRSSGCRVSRTRKTRMYRKRQKTLGPGRSFKGRGRFVKSTGIIWITSTGGTGGYEMQCVLLSAHACCNP